MCEAAPLPSLPPLGPSGAHQVAPPKLRSRRGSPRKGRGVGSWGFGSSQRSRPAGEMGAPAAWAPPGATALAAPR